MNTSEKLIPTWQTMRLLGGSEQMSSLSPWQPENPSSDQSGKTVALCDSQSI